MMTTLPPGLSWRKTPLKSCGRSHRSKWCTASLRKMRSYPCPSIDAKLKPSASRVSTASRTSHRLQQHAMYIQQDLQHNLDLSTDQSVALKRYLTGLPSANFLACSSNASTGSTQRMGRWSPQKWWKAFEKFPVPAICATCKRLSPKIPHPLSRLTCAEIHHAARRRGLQVFLYMFIVASLSRSIGQNDIAQSP
jgi:hypothetical protein